MVQTLHLTYLLLTFPSFLRKISHQSRLISMASSSISVEVDLESLLDLESDVLGPSLLPLRHQCHALPGVSLRSSMTISHLGVSLLLVLMCVN